MRETLYAKPAYLDMEKAILKQITISDIFADLSVLIMMMKFRVSVGSACK